MLALDELAVHSDLADVRGVVEQVLEYVAREDDRGRPVVLRLPRTALRTDAQAVEVVCERLEAEPTGRVQLEDLTDDGGNLGVLDHGAVDALVALRDDAENVARTLEVAEVVAHSARNLDPFLLGDDCLHLPRQLI